MNIGNITSYNDYPVTAIGLCEMAYITDEIVKTKASLITNAVNAAYTNQYDPNTYNPRDPPANTSINTPLDTTVVWGPVFKPSDGFLTQSLMYIVQVNNNTSAFPEYFVVIRGTNPISLTSWITEDLEVDKLIPLNTLPVVDPQPGYPTSLSSLISSDVTVSKAAFNGANDLINLADGSGQTALQFLQTVLTQTPGTYIYVTGHSLGGTLTPVMFAYLFFALGYTVSESAGANMAMWSFAGLTAGGNDFNDLIDTIYPGTAPYLWRIQNTLDVAPLLVGPSGNNASVPDSILTIYPGITIDTLAEDVLAKIFKKANSTSGANPPGEGFYLQPASGSCPVTGAVQSLPPSILIKPWAAQAAYQHHSSTYYQMVYQYFI